MIKETQRLWYEAVPRKYAKAFNPNFGACCDNEACFKKPLIFVRCTDKANGRVYHKQFCSKKCKEDYFKIIIEFEKESMGEIRRCICLKNT